MVRVVTIVRERLMMEASSQGIVSRRDRMVEMSSHGIVSWDRMVEMSSHGIVSWDRRDQRWSADMDVGHRHG
jgi:hypothetical protein